MGAGWRDHLFGHLRGPASPCSRPPLPRVRGGGVLPARPCTARARARWGATCVLWGPHSTAGAALVCGGSCGARTALLVRPWCAGVPVGPAPHCLCGPGVWGFLWGPPSTAGAALACGGSCGARTALLVRPRCAGFLWGLHSTAGAALACGGSCGARTALLVRPWRVGVPAGPAQHCWCGPGVWGFPWGLLSTAGAALACGGCCGGLHSTAGAALACGGGCRREGVCLGPPPAVGGP